MKKELRKTLLEKRKNIINKESKDQIIVNNIYSIIEKYQKIMIYYPISSEPNILNIIKIEDNKLFYLPFTCLLFLNLDYDEKINKIF